VYLPYVYIKWTEMDRVVWYLVEYVEVINITGWIQICRIMYLYLLIKAFFTRKNKRKRNPRSIDVLGNFRITLLFENSGQW
jgi:hypothetical protein